MTKKFSLIVLSDSGIRMKRFFFSHRQIYLLLLTCCVLIALLTFGSYHYFSMKAELAAKQGVEQRLARQTQLVTLQRRQIHQFANDINELKDQVLALSQLEDKIRLIANLDGDENSENLFSVGGSTPDDLNIDIESGRDNRLLMKEMHQQVEQISEATTFQHSSFETILEKLEYQKNLLAHTPSIRPTKGWISSKFGYRKSPFSSRREFHKGLDIANLKGTPIQSTADGVVTYLGENGNFGLMMVIDHGFGITTRYAHLDQGLKTVGDEVTRGDQIARMGNTGRSTGSHLHYEVRVHGVPVNPNKYIAN